MAKKKSPVDAALEIARKVRVPKKPVKAKGKKTVPTHLDWGPGIPEDKLAYLNDEEMALVQAKRGYKGKRSVDGIPAFPDPGDTAKGDSKPSSGGSSGPDRGPTGGPSSGNGGLGGGNKGGAGGAGGGGGGLGGGGQGGPSGGAGGTSSSGAGGGSDKGSQKTSTPSGGPSGGPTSAPSRTEASRAATPPSTFGPRVSNLPSNPVSTAPSTHAYEGALSRIAQGSSVIGNPSATGKPSLTKDQSRVPQSTPTAVNFSQTPTVGGPNRGLSGVSSNALTEGANSPFADPSVDSYTPSYSVPSAGPTRSATSSILGPSVPAGTAHLTPESIQRQASLYGSAPPASAPAATGSPPSMIGNMGAVTFSSLAEPPPQLSNYSVSIPNVSFGNVAKKSDIYADAARSGPSITGGAQMSPTGKTFTDRVGISTPSGEVSGSQLAEMALEDQQRLAGMSFAPPNTQAQNYGFVNPNVPTSPTRGIPAPTPAPAVTANNSFVSNPYQTSPAQQARDIRNAVSLALGDNTPTRTASAELNVPGWGPNVSPSQGDYSPSQAPPYDVSPSQQSGWTDAQREAYLSGLAGSRQSPVPPTQPNAPMPNVTPVAAVPPTYLQPMPDWVDYSYLYDAYPQIVSATPVIAGFNQYGVTMNRGGRIGSSIDAAMRLARQSIVSRNKTR